MTTRRRNLRGFRYLRRRWDAPTARTFRLGMLDFGRLSCAAVDQTDALNTGTAAEREGSDADWERYRSATDVRFTIFTRDTGLKKSMTTSCNVDSPASAE